MPLGLRGVAVGVRLALQGEDAAQPANGGGRAHEKEAAAFAGQTNIARFGSLKLLHYNMIRTDDCLRAKCFFSFYCIMKRLDGWTVKRPGLRQRELYKRNAPNIAHTPDGFSRKILSAMGRDETLPKPPFSFCLPLFMWRISAPKFPAWGVLRHVLRSMYMLCTRRHDVIRTR